jgi:predicted RNA binding protein YcfA (HicA-like mRNA interferase family)
MPGMRSTQRASRALQKLGFLFVDADGSHYHYRAPNGRRITIALGHREISEASLKKTCVLANVAWSDFEEQY